MDQHDQDFADFYSKASLQIGDYVLLQLSRPLSGWLAAEGLLDSDCSITNDADNFDSCIWQIHVQNQYSAAREYKEALLLSLESNEGQGPSNKNAKSAEHLNQLQRAALNELRLNDKLMSLKTGKGVAFGDPIQLRHVKSGKFLTVSSSQLAKEERENMLVHVDQEGDSLSCVGFMPRFKYDREGQVVPNGAEMVIRVHERPGEFLHSAATRSDLESKTEVNCSLESTFWTVTLYQRAIDLRSNFVLAGSLMMLQDPDTLMCITLERPFPPEIADASVVMAPNLKSNALEEGEGTNLLWTVEKVQATAGGPISVGSDQLVLRDLNSGRYLRIEPDGVVAVRNRTDASALEFHLSPKNGNQQSNLVEHDSCIIMGSAGMWFTQADKQKNQVNASCVGRTNKAIAVSLQMACVEHSKVNINVHVGVQATSSLRRLINVARDFSNGNVPLRAFSMVVKESLIILENACSFLAMSDTSVSDEAVQIMGSSDKVAITARQNMVREQGLVDAVLDLLELVEENVFDAIQAQAAPRTQRSSKSSVRKSGMLPLMQPPADDISDEELERAAPMPSKSKSAMGAATEKGNTPGRPSQRKSTVKTNSAPIAPESEKNPAMSSTGGSAARGRRRSMMASDSSAKATEMILTRRMSMSVGFASLLEEEEEEQNFAKVSGDSSTPISQQMAQKCLKVLLCLLINNHETQLYVADRLPTVLNQVKDHKIAVHCVEELLKENLTVLQTKVREREIEIFVNLLATTEMSVTFLKLLQSTCSCPQGVDATQRMVTYALFGQSMKDLEDTYNSGYHMRSPLMHSMSFKLNVTKKAVEISPSAYLSARSLVMQLSTSKTNLTPVVWKDFSVYCPEDPLSHVLGFEELSNGLPEIFVSWSLRGRAGEYAMEYLFGSKDKVPLVSVCAAATNNGLLTLTRGASAHVGASAGQGRRKASVMQLMQKKKAAATQMQLPFHPMSASSVKVQVAEYLNTQLFLAADLCLDRNYVAIGILENMFPYEMLVSMLKMEHGVPSKFKAAACRILRTMYVDREPHVAQKFPQYIRTSVSLAEESDFYDEGDHSTRIEDRYKFALLQQIISDYINEELDAHSCDELSAEMMDLLFALVNFGFYTTAPQILEVLRPLVRVLDEHQKKPAKKALALENGRRGEGVSKKPSKSRKTKILKSSKVAVKHTVMASEQPKGVSMSSRIFDNVKETIELENTVPWRRKFLRTTESLQWMMFTVYIVIASIALVFYQILTDTNQFELYLASTAYFAAEVSLRILAFMLVYSRFAPFLYDPFNVLDLCMVAFDVILLALDVYGKDFGAGRTARSIRIVRVLRLIRVFPVVNVITHLTQEEYQAQVDSFEVPQRYSVIPPMEARTIVNILKVMSMFYDRILDKKLDLTVKAFSLWCDDVKKKKKTDPVVLLHKMLSSEESITSELTSKFDNVLLDVLMYSDASMTQQALQLLMVHKSHKDQFLHIADKIQIVYSPRIEAICKNLTQMVRDLKSLAEMFEIWCDMETEEDQKSAERALETLGNIKGYLANTNDDRTMGVRSIVLVDEEVQHILRNLDAMTAFMALLEALYDGGREELRPQIRDIMSSCCDLICWFMKSLEANQMVAFKNIGWFMELIDEDINSSGVVRVMLEGNQALIKQCPRNFLIECAQKIVLSGRKPEYLDLFVGMTEFSRFAATSVTGVESEIASYLTAREWKEHVLLWCCTYDSDDYRERKRAMEKITKSALGPVTEDDLTSDLKYHIRVLTLLANCNLGPKIHAVYPIHDLLSAIVDPATIFPVKKALSNLLVEVVKSSIDRVEKSDVFWQLLEDMALTLETLPTDYVELSRNATMRIQCGEWIEIIASLCVSFFEGYDFSLHQESREKSIRNHSPDPRVIIDRMYKAVKTLVDYHGAKLGNVLLDELGFALSSLRLHVDAENLELGVVDDEDGDLNEAKLRIIRLQHQRASIIYADIQQVFFRKQFSVFLRTVKDVTPDSRLDVVNFFHRIPWVKDSTDAELRFEPVLKKLSGHFRALIKRAANSRTISDENGQVVETCQWLLTSLRHLMEHEMKATFDNITDVDVFTTQHTSRLRHLRLALNANGITYLCLDLICIGIEPSLRTEAMRLLIVMLLRNPFYAEIQQTIFTYLLETDSTLFFETVREMIENLKSWSTKENESEAVLMNQFANQSNHIPDDIIALYLLQSICEGEDCRVRDQLREQKGNSKVINLIETLASFVGILSRGDTMASTYVMSVLLRTVLRLVQGPCKGNQEQFVLNSELLMALNRIIRALRPTNSPMSAIWKHYLEELKEHLVDVLRGLIEGHPESSLVFDRVSSTIDVGVLHLLILSNKGEEAMLKKTKTPAELRHYMRNNPTAHNNAKLSKAQAKYLVLTQSLGRSVENYQSLSRVDNIEKNIAHVDIVWNQRVETVYFPIPEYVRELSGKELTEVVESMDDVGASREMKLAEFLDRCKQVYQRLLHQEKLKAFGLADLFSIKYFLVRFMFVNAFIMCVLLLLYYGTHDGTKHHTPLDIYHRRAMEDGGVLGGDGVWDDPRRLASGSTSDVPYVLHPAFISDKVDHILDCLNIIQIICALFTLVILLIVEVPVTLISAMERHKKDFLQALLRTVMEPLPIWYLIYFVCTILAFWVNRTFITVLLLDWVVLDPTTQDVLLAIRYPVKQLVATLIIIVIVLNIFSSVVFVLYRSHVVTVSVNDLWDAFKLCISYGFRGEYGVDHEMEPTLSERMVLDIIFYFVVLSILRHIFFAIIVDTFGKLRELKMEREHEARNTCFICGIERHEYDRIVSPGTGLTFLQHRMVTHNPSSYIYFILNIWQQNPAEDSSLEIYVRNCLSKKDVGWMPTGILQKELLVEEVESKHAQAVNGGEATGSGTPRDGSGGGAGGGGGGKGKASKHLSLIHAKASVSAPVTEVVSNAVQHESHMEIMDKMNTLQKHLFKLTKNMDSSAMLPFNPNMHDPMLLSPPTESPKPMAPSRLLRTGSFKDDDISAASSIVAGTSLVNSVAVSMVANSAAMIVAAQDAVGATSPHPESSRSAASAVAAPPTEPTAPIIQQVIIDNSPQLLALAAQNERTTETLSRLDTGLMLVIERLEKLERKFVKSHKYLRQRIEHKSSGGMSGMLALTEGEGTQTEDESPPRQSRANRPKVSRSREKEAELSTAEPAAEAVGPGPVVQHILATAVVEPQNVPIKLSTKPGEMPRVISQAFPESQSESELDEPPRSRKPSGPSVQAFVHDEHSHNTSASVAPVAAASALADITDLVPPLEDERIEERAEERVEEDLPDESEPVAADDASAKVRLTTSFAHTEDLLDQEEVEEAVQEQVRMQEDISGAGEALADIEGSVPQLPLEVLAEVDLDSNAVTAEVAEHRSPRPRPLSATKPSYNNLTSDVEPVTGPPVDLLGHIPHQIDDEKLGVVPL